MEKYTQLKEEINSMEEDIQKFYEKSNKVAAVRIRKSLQVVKKLAQDLRDNISEVKKQMPKKSKKE